MFKWVNKQGNNELLARGSRPAVFIFRFEGGKKGKVSLSRTADFILFHPGSDSPVLPFTDLWRTPRQRSRLRKCHIPALTAWTSRLDKSGREQAHHAQLTPVTLLRQSRAAHECNPRPERFKKWRNLLLTGKSSLRKEAHFLSENRHDLATLGVDGLDKMDKLSPIFLICTRGASDGHSSSSPWRLVNHSPSSSATRSSWAGERAGRIDFNPPAHQQPSPYLPQGNGKSHTVSSCQDLSGS